LSAEPNHQQDPAEIHQPNCQKTLTMIHLKKWKKFIPNQGCHIKGICDEHKKRIGKTKVTLWFRPDSIVS
jgi:hypothetical protein